MRLIGVIKPFSLLQHIQKISLVKRKNRIFGIILGNR